MDSMFGSCGKLETIVVGSGFVTDSVVSSDSMFDDCSVLVGGANTKFDSKYTDKTYARIDKGTRKPGYFTDASASAVSNTKTVTVDFSALTNITAVPGGDAQ